MKTALAICLAALSFSLVACSKHECDLKTDAEKATFGTLADMTHGAFSCSVEGVRLDAEDGPGMMGDAKCEIGSAPACLAKMNAIHASPAKVKEIAASYKAFLEKAQWKVEEKDVKSKYMSGKEIEGVELRGTSGDKKMMISVFPFGDDMVETRTYVGPLK